jgi:hypothetical protein
MHIWQVRAGVEGNVSFVRTFIHSFILSTSEIRCIFLLFLCVRYAVLFFLLAFNYGFGVTRDGWRERERGGAIIIIIISNFGLYVFFSFSKREEGRCGSELEEEAVLYLGCDT